MPHVVIFFSIPKAKYLDLNFPLTRTPMLRHSISICPCKLSRCRYSAIARRPLPSFRGQLRISFRCQTNSPPHCSARNDLILVPKWPRKARPRNICPYTLQWTSVILIAFPKPVSKRSRLKIQYPWPWNCAKKKWLLALYRDGNFIWDKISI